MKVLDLFSGIGGFSLGLRNTGGFETVKFCEIDPHCRRVLARHWPDVPCHDDVQTLEFKEGEADVITAGFPCQDVSNAGKGAGLAGERSGLYRHVVRAVRVVRPLVAIMENVAALLGRGLGAVLGDMAEIGYDSEWHCIPAVALGAPHERDRIWIIAYANGWRWGAKPAGRHDANGQDAGRAQADCLLGALPLPNRQWYLAAPDAPHDHGQRRREYYGAEIAVQPEVSGLAGVLGHDGWETPWPCFLEGLCRVDDGLRGGLDKAGFQALGNAILPQIPQLIGEAINTARTEGEAA